MGNIYLVPPLEYMQVPSSFMYQEDRFVLITSDQLTQEKHQQRVIWELQTT